GHRRRMGVAGELHGHGNFLLLSPSIIEPAAERAIQAERLYRRAAMSLPICAVDRDADSSPAAERAARSDHTASLMRRAASVRPACSSGRTAERMAGVGSAFC